MRTRAGKPIILAMASDRQYYIYILTNKNDTVLYTGVTNDLARRIFEHKQGITGGFTKRYNLNKLVYFEIFNDAYSAIEREKQIKKGSRARKITLIETLNPGWRDLYPDVLDP